MTEVEYTPCQQALDTERAAAADARAENERLREALEDAARRQGRDPWDEQDEYVWRAWRHTARRLLGQEGE